MTEYEYNLTFTVEKHNTAGTLYCEGDNPNKKTIDLLFLKFMEELVEQKVQEMSCYVSEKEKVN